MSEEDEDQQYLEATQEGEHDAADDDDEQELIPAEDSAGGEQEESIESLMEVMTVTSRKLQAMTQGRKFRAAPKRSIEDRKKSSACSACGQIGHWAGDQECPVSSKGKSEGKGNVSNLGKGSVSSKPLSAVPADWRWIAKSFFRSACSRTRDAVQLQHG